jgi:DNA-binding NarL/FixJ family response regulator
LPISLVLADDHPIVLRGLSDLFEGEPGFVVLDRCATGADAIRAVGQHTPDVLVLDLLLPDQDGLAVLRTMAAKGLCTKTVILSASIREDAVVEAVRLGVAGIVLKDAAPGELVECVRRVHAGHAWYDSQLMGGSLLRTVRQADAWRTARAVLTDRETEIIRMVADGLRNKAIGDALGVSEGTVKVHVHNIFKKLHLQNRVELVRYAQEMGLI